MAKPITMRAVAQVMQQAAIDNGMTPGNMYNLQTLVAEYLVHPKSPAATIRFDSSVRVHPEVVTIDGNPIALPRMPQVVVDYAAV